MSVHRLSFRPLSLHALFLYLVTACLIVSSIYMVAYHWPRGEGRNYFFVCSTLGVCALFCLSLTFLERNVSFGLVLLFLHAWLLLVFIWSGYVGAGLWLRYYNIYNDGSTLEFPLPLGNNTLDSIDWAENDLPFDPPNPTYMTFENWTDAVLRLDYLTSSVRDCSYANSGYISRFCAVPLVYHSWEPTEPVFVWASCSGDCELSVDEFGNKLPTSSCSRLISKGRGCFKWWRHLLDISPNGSEPYPEEYNFGYRHFQYIHKHREAVSRSPCSTDSLLHNLVFVRLSSPTDVEYQKKKNWRNGVIMILTPLLMGYVPLSIIFFWIFSKSVSIARRDPHSSNTLHPSDHDTGNAVEMTSMPIEPAVLPVNFEQLETLPTYADLDVPPPEYEP